MTPPVHITKARAFARALADEVYTKGRMRLSLSRIKFELFTMDLYARGYLACLADKASKARRKVHHLRKVKGK
jgi:hypothetical protein